MAVLDDRIEHERLRLVHTGLPHPALAGHDKGWHGYLSQLAGASEFRRQ